MSAIVVLPETILRSLLRFTQQMVWRGSTGCFHNAVRLQPDVFASFLSSPVVFHTQMTEVHLAGSLKLTKCFFFDSAVQYHCSTFRGLLETHRCSIFIGDTYVIEPRIQVSKCDCRLFHCFRCAWDHDDYSGRLLAPSCAEKNN